MIGSREYQAVIFDLFGTLVEVIRHDEYERNLRQMAVILQASADDFAGCWGKEAVHQRVTGVFTSIEANLRWICDKQGLNPGSDAICQASAIRHAYYHGTLVPRSESVPLLKRLKQMGMKTGLISDCSCEAPEIWPSLPLAPLIDAAVFSCLDGCRKPDPRLYERACKRLAVDPEQCLYIGDGDNQELEGAEKVGMRALLLAAPGEDGASAYRYYERTRLGAKIKSLAEVFDLISTPTVLYATQ